MAEYNVFKLEGNCLKIDLGRYKGCADLSSLASEVAANWGSITGTLSNQTDLVVALALKANTSALAGYLPITGGLLTGTAGNGKITFPTQSFAPSTPASGFSLYANGSNALSWKGANGFIRVFDGTANTADRVYTLPDASGTFGLLESNQSWTGLNTFGGSTTPTHSITLASTSTGWTYYNTSDQVTNYERVRGYFNTNTYTLSSEKGGTGTVRNIALAVGGTVYDTLFSTGNRFFGSSPVDSGYKVDINGTARVQNNVTVGGDIITSASGSSLSLYSGNFKITASGSGQATLASYNTQTLLFSNIGYKFTNNYAGVGLTGTTGISKFASFDYNVNQSGIAGYTGIFTNVTETSTGSGTKLLADFQVGGVSKFNIDRGGSTTAIRYVSTQPTAITATSTTTVDLSTGNMFQVNMGTNITTLTLSNPAVGTYVIKFTQDATGSRTVVFPTIKWSGGTVPTLTTTANKIDILTLIYDGTSYYGTLNTNFS